MINLRYCLITAQRKHKETRHAQEVMRELGIAYQLATPQSIADQWWFWNCENVPDALPAYLTPLNLRPEQAIGNGLSAEDVRILTDKEQPE